MRIRTVKHRFDLALPGILGLMMTFYEKRSLGHCRDKLSSIMWANLSLTGYRPVCVVAHLPYQCFRHEQL